MKGKGKPLTFLGTSLILSQTVRAKLKLRRKVRPPTSREEVKDVAQSLETQVFLLLQSSALSSFPSSRQAKAISDEWECEAFGRKKLHGEAIRWERNLGDYTQIPEAKISFVPSKMSRLPVLSFYTWRSSAVLQDSSSLLETSLLHIALIQAAITHSSGGGYFCAEFAC